MHTKQADKNFLVRSGEPLPIEIKNSEGCYIIDANGKKYMDFITGWCVGNLGWGNRILKKAISTYNGPAYVFPKFIYKPWADLAGLLAQVAPGKLNKCFRATGGSEAVDTALQIAMAYTGRKRFMTIEGCYHGNTISAVSIGDSRSAKKLTNRLQDTDHVSLPLNEKALKKIKTRLQKKETAAFIIEPVICNLGVYIPGTEFFKELQHLCKKYGTLLIIDEVATGFGRTGKLFACEHFNLKPDILCLAKGMTSGYAGMGATMTTDKIANKIKNKVSIYSTYGWHPLSVNVALTNIYYIANNKQLFKHINQLSELFAATLSNMPFRENVKIRLLGLAIAIELESRSYAEKIVKKALKKYLVISNQGNTIVLFPPLNIITEDVTKGLNIIKQCL